MKKNFLFLGVISVILTMGLFTQSCNKIEDLVAFDVQQTLPDQHFDVDSSATTAKGAEIILNEAFLDINLDSILSANGIDQGTLSNSQFKEIVVIIDNPTPQMEMGFVSTLTLKLYRNKDFTDGFTIASATGIKAGDVSATFAVNNDNIDAYLQSSKFYYRIYGTLEHSLPVNKLPLIFSSKVKFTVKPLK